MGCEKNSGEAVVLAKEHIDAALPTAETPNAHVMKPEDRGTSRDPRALQHEQWIVKVRMRDNTRTIQVHADRMQWEKLRENDRVKVTYRVGRFTGTVWDAEIE
jgi:hypothetical protein